MVAHLAHDEPHYLDMIVTTVDACNKRLVIPGAKDRPQVARDSACYIHGVHADSVTRIAASTC